MSTSDSIPVIRIFGQPELEAFLNSGGTPHSHLISIGNPRRTFRLRGIDSRIPDVFRERYRRVLRLEFFDVEERRHLPPGQFPKRVPRKSDVRRVLRFYENTRSFSDGYDIHCWGGISRSTGVALGLLYLETGSEKEAGRLLADIRPQAGPHQKIVGWFDELLGSDLRSANAMLRDARLRRWREELGMPDPDDLEELPAL